MSSPGPGVGTRLTASAAAMLIGVALGIYGASLLSSSGDRTRLLVAVVAGGGWVVAGLTAAKLPFGDEEGHRGKGLIGIALGLGILIGPVVRAMDPELQRNVIPVLAALGSGWFVSLSIRAVIHAVRLASQPSDPA